MRLACRELLFELKNAVEVRDPIDGLRKATLEDLVLYCLSMRRSPLPRAASTDGYDSEGFRKRCARRIEKAEFGLLFITTAHFQGRYSG